MTNDTKIIAYYPAIALFLIFSCNSDIVFNDFQPVPDKVWDRQSEFLFHFELNEAAIPYNISLQLRNSIFYPYQNLWILFDALDQTEVIVNDTIEFLLADKSGKWTGNGVTLFQNQFPLRTNYHFPDTGKYTIRIRHGMVAEQLHGIENVGLFIEKTR